MRTGNGCCKSFSPVTLVLRRWCDSSASQSTRAAWPCGPAAFELCRCASPHQHDVQGWARTAPHVSAALVLEEFRAGKPRLLRIARTMFEDSDPNLGWKTFVELAGKSQAEQALPELRLLAKQQADPVIASNAITVLAELGPFALHPELVPQILELFEAASDRASDLSEVALRVHAWGGECRKQLCSGIVTGNHTGGRHLVEVLLQMLNRCDEKRQQRAAKVLTGCFSMAEAKEWMYTNDSRLLVEVLLREIPGKVEDPKTFRCFSSCIKALLLCSHAARQHRRDELWQVLEDLRQDDQLELSVRQDCVEVLEVMSYAERAAPHAEPME
ncbi:unnamed protein product [Effrenium voratum]|nr:unnamed protein product [Effrenium voratum]